MIVTVKDNGMTSVFNSRTGTIIRNKDNFMASYPHLIDVGIMGHCQHGRSGLCFQSGVECYQRAAESCNPNMTFQDFKKIVDESKGNSFQFALGGAGDPDMHENFFEILEYCSNNKIVPNFTTSGLGMTKEKAEICKKFCGAVAVSMYSRLYDTVPYAAWKRINEKRVYNSEDEIPVLFTLGDIYEDCVEDCPGYRINGERYRWDEVHHIPFGLPDNYEYFRIFEEEKIIVNHKELPNYTMNAIKMLVDAGVKTNIHFVVNNSTIEEAIIRLKYNGFPRGIHAVVFLLHKPVGYGSEKNVLSIDNPKVQEFFELASKMDYPFKIGFDSCSVPGLLNLGNIEDKSCIDTCEGGRYSMYISSDMVAYPCSFDNQDKKYAFSLKDKTIRDAWNSPEFEKFRSCLKNSCPDCPDKNHCMGGCPLKNEIVLCNRAERQQKGE